MKTLTKILFLSILMMFLSRTEYAQCPNKKKNVECIVYDVQKKQIETRSKSYNQTKNFVIVVKNINRLIYDVEGDLSEITYTLDKDINKPEFSPMNSPLINQITNNKAGIKERAKTKEEDLAELLQKQMSNYNTLTEITRKLYNLLKSQGFCSHDPTPDQKSLADIRTGYYSSAAEIEGLQDFLWKTQKDTIDANRLSLLNEALAIEKSLNEKFPPLFQAADSILLFFSDPDRCTYYYPEFTTSAEELDMIIRYKKKSDATIPFTEIKLPTIRLSKFLRMGFGTGPTLVYTPKQQVYFKNILPGVTGGSDSLYFTSKTPRNKISFSIAAFTDLDYQITPTTSVGIGIGGGLLVDREITGTLFSGFNVGFRIARQVQVTIRSGLSFSQKDVLADRFDENTHYAASELGDNDYLQKKWMPGFFIGATLSYMTKSISSKNNSK